MSAKVDAEADALRAFALHARQRDMRREMANRGGTENPSIAQTAATARGEPPPPPRVSERQGQANDTPPSSEELEWESRRDRR